jgi:hypothetical protein
MARDKLILKTPKYHPETGIELDGDYAFEFQVSEEQFRIQELLIENSSLKERNLELKYLNQDFSLEIYKLKSLLSDLEEKQERYKKLLGFKRGFREFKKRTNYIRRKFKSAS